MAPGLPFPNGKLNAFPSQTTIASVLRRRRTPILTVLLLLLVVLPWLYRKSLFSYPHPPDVDVDLIRKQLLEVDHPTFSPSYAQIREYERQLPQNNASLPFPEGRDGRYVRFSNEWWSLGLNNQLQDRMLHMHLAFLSNRAYVFTDTTFTTNQDFTNQDDWHPLNTFINGPTAGGALPPVLAAAGIPRAVPRDYFDEICPVHRRTIVNADDIHQKYGLSTWTSDGLPTLENWVKELREMPDLCVEIHPSSQHIFDFPLTNSQRLLSLFPSFATSPALTGFVWSQTVRYAVSRNLPNILGLNPGSNFNSSQQQLTVRESLSDVLALHIRRGDFEHHCYGVAGNGWSYNSWNQLPALPDKYFANHYIHDGPELDEFLIHCWPSIERIVERVRQVKQQYESQGQGRTLRRVYVLSNGKREWGAELKAALNHAGMGWQSVVWSRDLKLSDGPERLAAQATDMAIASKAAVLLGNGFSTMTANIVLLRLTSGFEPDTCRFW